MKEETKTSIVTGCVVLLVCGVFFTLVLYPALNEMMKERTITGTVERVELLAGHIGSTSDKCIMAFSGNVTVILDYRAFGEANALVGKHVTMTYREYGQIIRVVEG